MNLGRFMLYMLIFCLLLFSEWLFIHGEGLVGGTFDLRSWMSFEWNGERQYLLLVK